MIEIKGHLFRVITAPKESKQILNLPYKADDIYNAYKTTPSSEKISTWESWKKWADELNFTMWVSSSNTWKYIIGFHGEYEGQVIFGYITDTHHKVVII